MNIFPITNTKFQINKARIFIYRRKLLFISELIIGIKLIAKSEIIIIVIIFCELKWEEYWWFIIITIFALCCYQKYFQIIIVILKIHIH